MANGNTQKVENIDIHELTNRHLDGKDDPHVRAALGNRATKHHHHHHDHHSHSHYQQRGISLEKAQEVAVQQRRMSQEAKVHETLGIKEDDVKEILAEEGAKDALGRPEEGTKDSRAERGPAPTER